MLINLIVRLLQAIYDYEAIHSASPYVPYLVKLSRYLHRVWRWLDEDAEQDMVDIFSCVLFITIVSILGYLLLILA